MAGPGIVQGKSGGAPVPIGAVLDGTDYRMMVDAKFTSGFVAEVNLDLANDEVMVGNTTDGGTTRNLAKGDASGRFQIDVERLGNNAINVGSGTIGTGTQRVTIATDDTVATDLTAIRTSVQIMDDWDESDRAKVNLIVGQAGVQGGSGAVSATTQRVVLATDVALPAGSNAIGTVTAVGPAADGAAVSGNPVRIAGKDESGLTQDIITGPLGRIWPFVGVLSTVNSRANSNLGASTTFTGSYEDILNYTGFSLGILDAGASGGTLTIDWSDDGVTSRDTDTVAVPTANGQQYTWGRKWRYFRVSYTHGAAAGNVLIQTLLNAADGPTSTHFGSDTITTGQDGPLVHAANRVLNGTSFLNQQGDSSGNAIVVGNIAHDGVDSGSPVKIGGRAIAHGTNPTAVAAADRTDWLFNRAGIPWVIGGHPNIRSTEYNWTTAQTNDDILGAISSGTKVVVTAITMTLDEATTVGVSCRVGFGTASVPAAPADGASVEGVVLSHVGVVPGGGIVRGDGSGIIGIGADGEELRITAEAPTSGTGRLIVTWYTIES